AFDYPKEKVQIIIGDDSNDPLVSQKIDAFAQETGVEVTRRGENIGFKPGNLNHMLKFTRGDFIVIFDSDFLPKKDFLRRIISPFVHDENIHGVQARWKMKNFSQNLSSIVGSTIPMFSHQLGLPFMQMIGSNGFIAGSAEAVRKSTLIEQGGWTSGAFTEDIEYSMRLTKAGKKIVYLEKLECECEAPFTVADLCKQQLRWAYGVIKSCKMHFVDIMKSRKVSFAWKVNPMLLLAGYLVTFQFFLLFVLGMLSIITHEPSPVNWALFFTKTGINILLTSGFVVSSIILLNRTKRRSDIPRMIGASFSVGLLVVYTVSKGVLKALFNRPMFWFMLNKKGNTV
ncbi:MAG: glycosyltransferase, partial [Nanoarchaeota archaeon]|nr:glycosyltransferase [Nanoarchaeota archaeon]